MADFFAKGKNPINGYAEPQKDWIDGGTFSTTGVNLPTDYKELLIVVDFNNYGVVETSVVNKKMLSATEISLRQGYYGDGNTNGYFGVAITASTIRLVVVRLNGTVVTNTSTAKYYYR